MSYYAEKTKEAQVEKVKPGSDVHRVNFGYSPNMNKPHIVNPSSYPGDGDVWFKDGVTATIYYNSERQAVLDAQRWVF